MARWHVYWHAGTFIGTLARKNKKLARFWHVGTQARLARDLANSFKTSNKNQSLLPSVLGVS